MDYLVRQETMKQVSGLVNKPEQLGRVAMARLIAEQSLLTAHPNLMIDERHSWDPMRGLRWRRLWT